MRTANPHVRSFFRGNKKSAFTLVELVIVIMVIAVLAVILFASLNVVEIAKATRDTTRMQDLQALNKRVVMYQINGNQSFGSSNTVYISLPDSNANCSSYTLPTLPGGWNYACRPAASYQNIDGTGWIPVDLSGNNSSTSASKLPVDPVNSVNGRLYYSYIPSGNTWEINVQMEAQTNQLAGSTDKVSSDGGDDPSRVELGTNLALAPWSFEFATFPTVASNSGFPGWFASAANGTYSVTSDGTSNNYIEFNGYRWYGWQENIPFNSSATYAMTCKVRQVTDPVSGGKGFYCGWNGVDADGTTLVNVNGANSTSSQHYHTMTNTTYTAGSGWNSRTGYTKGWSATGSGSSCTNPATPCAMHQNTRYIRPMFIVNYSAGNGVCDIDSITITKY